MQNIITSYQNDAQTFTKTSWANYAVHVRKDVIPYFTDAPEQVSVESPNNKALADVQHLFLDENAPDSENLMIQNVEIT